MPGSKAKCEVTPYSYSICPRKSPWEVSKNERSSNSCSPRNGRCQSRLCVNSRSWAEDDSPKAQANAGGARSRSRGDLMAAEDGKHGELRPPRAVGGRVAGHVHHVPRPLEERVGMLLPRGRR